MANNTTEEKVKKTKSKYTKAQLEAELAKPSYTHPTVDADILLAKANACYKAKRTKIKLELESCTENEIKLRNPLNEIRIRFTRLANNYWNYQGQVIFTNGLKIRDTTITWEKNPETGEYDRLKLINVNCLDEDESKREELIDDTYNELMPFLYHSSCSGPLWLWLHGVDMENHIRKMMQPIFFDLPWSELNPHLERYFPELQHPNLKEFYNTMGIKDSRLRNLLQQNTEKMKPYDFIRRAKEVSSFIQNGVDTNHIVHYWDLFDKISNDNQAEALQNLLEFYPYETIMRQLSKAESFSRDWQQFQDVSRLYKKLLNLNNNIVVPKANNINEFHDILSKLIVAEEARRESAPFDYNPGEREVVEAITHNGYEVRLPQSKACLRAWGSLQGHCIGTYAPTTTMRLLSFWKNNSIVSCMELEFHWKRRVDQSTKETVFYPECQASIRQHRGFKNYDPKMDPEDKKALEAAVVNFYSLRGDAHSKMQEAAKAAAEKVVETEEATLAKFQGRVR